MMSDSERRITAVSSQITTSALFKIKNDVGIPAFTELINLQTGESLPGVVAIRWEMDIRKQEEVCRAWVLLDGVDISAAVFNLESMSEEADNEPLE